MKVQFSLRINSDLLKEIKIMSIEKNQTISETIEILILKSLPESRKKNLSLDSLSKNSQK